MLFSFVTRHGHGPRDGDSFSLPPKGPIRHDGAVYRMGMWMFVWSLSVLFAGLLILILIKRHDAEQWPAGLRIMPVGLWLATGLIVGVSVAIQRALGSVRRDRATSVQTWLTVTAVLCVLFLAVQTLNWIAVFSLPKPQIGRTYLDLVYLFTGLHAAHVVGGLIPVCIVTYRAFHGAYTRHHHVGIRNLALYWHFIDAVWLVMFPALFWPS